MSTTRPKVVIPREPNLPPWAPELETRLGGTGAEIADPICATEYDLIETGQDALIVIPRGAKMRGFLNREVLPQLKSVHAIITSGVGYDGVDVEAATELGIPVANTAEFCAIDLAEHALALMFSAAKRVCSVDAAMRSKERVDAFRALHNEIALGYSPLYRLAGKVAGIVGFGRSGKALAERLKGCGLRVIAYDHHADRKRDIFESYGVEPVSLTYLLQQADLVSLHVPLTRATYHIIGEKELGAMKKSAILVNISRGELIDEKALYRSLKEKQIMAAGLDVFENEPFSPDNPLAQLDNIVLSPHLAAASVESLDERLSEIASNIRRVLSGQRPANVINVEVYQ
jgi:phosphoglycerate dehydrogenase-like enzyme